MMIPNKETEVWRPAFGFTGYEVSNLGSVRSYRPSGPNRRMRTEPVYLKPFFVDGYPRVNLTKGRGVTVHRLVAEAFIGPRPPGAECRHLDGNRKNPRADNLRWGTRSENMQDAVAHGTLLGRTPGSKHGGSKLTEEEVLHIRALVSKGVSGCEVARRFGVASETVYLIRDRKTWTHI